MKKHTKVAEPTHMGAVMSKTRGAKMNVVYSPDKGGSLPGPATPPKGKAKMNVKK